MSAKQPNVESWRESAKGVDRLTVVNAVKQDRIEPFILILLFIRRLLKDFCTLIKRVVWENRGRGKATTHLAEHGQRGRCQCWHKAVDGQEHHWTLINCMDVQFSLQKRLVGVKRTQRENTERTRPSSRQR